MGLTTGQWIALSTFYTTYLFFGAIVFYHIEHELEAERRYKALEARIEINGKYFDVNSFIHIKNLVFN